MHFHMGLREYHPMYFAAQRVGNVAPLTMGHRAAAAAAVVDVCAAFAL